MIILIFQSKLREAVSKQGMERRHCCGHLSWRSVSPSCWTRWPAVTASRAGWSPCGSQSRRCVRCDCRHSWTDTRNTSKKILQSTLDGRWKRKPFGLSRVQPIYLSVPPLLGCMSILFLNTLTLLAPTQSANNLFHSLTVLCENDNFLISSIHCSFAKATLYPLVLLFSITEKNAINIFIIIQYCKHFCLISSQSPGL